MFDLCYRYKIAMFFSVCNTLYKTVVTERSCSYYKVRHTLYKTVVTERSCLYYKVRHTCYRTGWW